MESLFINDYTNYDFTVSYIQTASEKVHPSNWRYEEKNGRKFHGLVYIYSGSAAFHTSEETFSVQKNSILLMPKGSRYLIVSKGETPLHLAVISFNLLEDTIPVSIPLHHVTDAPNSLSFSNKFHELINSWFMKGIAYKMKCKTILQEVLFQLILHTINQEMYHKNLPRIQSAVDYMDKYYDKQIKLDDLAKIVDMSTTHFRRMFKEIYRVSPIDYLNTLRMNRAKDLIMSHMYSIGEVAQKVGYSNIYYFSRAFKKVLGKPPLYFKL